MYLVRLGEIDRCFELFKLPEQQVREKAGNTRIIYRRHMLSRKLSVESHLEMCSIADQEAIQAHIPLEYLEKRVPPVLLSRM